MAIIPAGYCEVTFCSAPQSGYRESCTSCGFSIAGFSTTEGPTGIFGAWQVFLGGIGYNASSPARIVIKVGTSDPSAPLVYQTALSTAGSGTNAVSQPQVSMLATKVTALGGRKGRGRMFLPAPLEASCDKTGLLDSTYRGNCQTSLNTMISSVETIVGGDAYLLHTDNTAPTAITSIQLSSYVATQRRRMSRG